MIVFYILYSKNKRHPKELRYIISTMINNIRIMLLVSWMMTLSEALFGQKTVTFANHEGRELEARIDGGTGTANRIYGVRDYVGRYGIIPASLDSTTIIQLGVQIFNAYSRQLLITEKDVQIRKVDTDGFWWFVDYEQQVNGIPVKYSEVGFTIDPNGYIVALGAIAYPDIPKDMPSPSLTADEAQRIAQSVFDEKGSEVIYSPKLKILPIVEQENYSFYVIWEVTLRSLYPVRNITYYVDAQTGRILHETNNVRHTDIHGTVTGGYWPENATDTPVNDGFVSRITITNSLGQTVVNAQSNQIGSYSTGNIPYQYYNVTFQLTNSWVQIRDNANSGNPVIHAMSGSPGQYDYIWTATDGTNVHWHATKMHDFFRGNPFNYSGVDYQMRGYVNDGTGTNGSADGTNIYFGSQASMPWARSRDVITHEYTHNVINKIYNGWIDPTHNYYSQSYAMDEGIADFFAVTTKGSSLFAFDVGVNRNMSNIFSWAPGNGGHWNGQVIGGALWRTRQAVGTTIGNNLAFKALQVVPRARNFEDYLYNVYLVDIGQYGGSNLSDIEAAFGIHDISSIIPPPSPPALSINTSGFSPELSWSSVSGATSYNIYAGSVAGAPGTVNCNSVLSFSLLDATTSTSYTDYSVIIDPYESTFVCYQVTAVHGSGETAPSNQVGTQGMAPLKEVAYHRIPSEFSLLQNYPNPFNPTTTFQFGLPETAQVSLKVYTVAGQWVATLTDGSVNAGFHEAGWDASRFPSGMYILRMQTMGASGVSHQFVRKLTLLK